LGSLRKKKRKEENGEKTAHLPMEVDIVWEKEKRKELGSLITTLSGDERDTSGKAGGPEGRIGPKGTEGASEKTPRRGCGKKGKKMREFVWTGGRMKPQRKEKEFHQGAKVLRKEKKSKRLAKKAKRARGGRS